MATERAGSGTGESHGPNHPGAGHHRHHDTGLDAAGASTTALTRTPAGANACSVHKLCGGSRRPGSRSVCWRVAPATVTGGGEDASAMVTVWRDHTRDPRLSAPAQAGAPFPVAPA